MSSANGIGARGVGGTRRLRTTLAACGAALLLAGALTGGALAAQAAAGAGEKATGAQAGPADAGEKAAGALTDPVRDLASDPLAYDELIAGGLLAPSTPEAGGSLADAVLADDAACRTCHAALCETMADETLLSAPHQDVPCTLCHAQDEAFSTAHEDCTDDTEKKLKKLRTLKSTEVATAVCATCHGDWEGLAALTADSAALTDANGLVANPHLVATDLNTAGQHGAVTCASCHVVHAAKRPLEEQAQRLCLQCHHSNTYECYTCHA